MREVFTFLAICGVTYGAYVIYSLGMFTDAQRDELRSKEEDFVQRISAGGGHALLLSFFRPVVWIVTLPMKSSLAAFGLVMLLVLPALITK